MLSNVIAPVEPRQSVGLDEVMTRVQAVAELEQVQQESLCKAGLTWKQDEWRCASGMCFAGHAVDMAGWRWVLEDWLAKDAQSVARKALPAVMIYVIAPDFVPDDLTDTPERAWGHHLTPECGLAGVRVMSAAQAADYLLSAEAGVDAVSEHGLFEANNSLHRLERIIEDIKQEVGTS